MIFFIRIRTSEVFNLSLKTELWPEQHAKASYKACTSLFTRISMEIDTEELLLQKCRTLIEQKLGWGDAAAWATNDYERLSQKIQEVTNVNLSIATLKRLWGKIRYNSRPTITTLNTLAQYLGFENWRAFTQYHNALNGNSHAHQNHGQATPHISPPVPAEKKNFKWLILVAGVLLLAGAFVFVNIKTKTDTAPNPSAFRFSSEKVVDEGIPNTVVFDYDASEASPDDTIFIQQSWDKRLRSRVNRDDKQHTSIYYYPGFFEAKLIVNEKVVKEHNLFIKTTGWLPCVEQKPVPVYFKEAEAMKQGTLTLPLEKIKQANVALQPDTPWVSFYNVRDFGDMKSDDFVFETVLRNDYSEGAAVCQHTRIHILMEGSTMVIPLSIKGCVSELNFMGTDGKKKDLSALGVDFGNWVKVKCVFKEQEARIFINDNEVFKLDANKIPVRVVGIAYRFKGTGSIDWIRLSKSDGKVFYEENF